MSKFGKLSIAPSIAIVNVLEKKGILTAEEVQEELDKIKEEIEKE